MRAVITGGAGFLGSRLARSILERGQLTDASGARRDVKNLVLIDIVPASINDPRVEVITGDLADPALIERALTAETDSVFHLAAVVSGQAEAEFDTGMHVKGWTREQAIAYSLENEGGRKEDQIQEIERYMAIPGQALAYKIGELEIMALRRRAEQALGARFDIRAFHDELLKDGNLPLAVLVAKVNRWIDAQQAAKAATASN